MKLEKAARDASSFVARLTSTNPPLSNIHGRRDVDQQLELLSGLFAHLYIGPAAVFLFPPDVGTIPTRRLTWRLRSLHCEQNSTGSPHALLLLLEYDTVQMYSNGTWDSAGAALRSSSCGHFF